MLIYINIASSHAADVSILRILGVLQLAGHLVRHAHDGATALGIAAEFHPQAVVLDLGLPGMTGHEVARRLRAANTGPPPLLIALTGYGQPEDTAASLAAGFDHHLVKPVPPDVLLDLLDAEERRPTPV